MLGLILWSLNCFFYDYDVLGSIFFCLALGFKQMALYFAPAIFAYLLGKCIKNKSQGWVITSNIINLNYNNLISSRCEKLSNYLGLSSL